MAQKRNLTSVYNTTAIAGTGVAAASVAGLAAFGPLGFAAPAVLGGLAVLGPLWYVMRSTPPKPVEIDFPWLAILRDILPKEQKPLQMPLWQKLLRSAAAAAVIIGLAQPQWNPDTAIEGQGPVMLVVDNGWGAARNWTHRVNEMNRAVDRAERQNRPVIIMSTARNADGGAPQVSASMNAGEARAAIKSLKPHSWPTDHKAATTAIEAMADSKAAALLLSDGIDDDSAAPMVKALQDKTNLTVVRDKDGQGPRLLAPKEATRDALILVVRRVDREQAEVIVSASDETGHVLAEEKAIFKTGESEARVVFKLPADIRNQLARVAIEGDNSAGATVLLDERWRHRPVGIVGGAVNGEQIPYSEADFIQKAIGPSSDLHSGPVGKLLQDKMAVMIVPDNTILDDKAMAALDQWVENGGMLVRFAGPHLADADHSKDKLLPVELQPRSRGVNNLAEDKSGRLGPFEKGTPFEGLTLSEHVKIERFVEARRVPELSDKTWARLEDGTPIVTAAKHGKGMVVLIHTTADRNWSNLPLSGLFVDMLTRVVAQSQGEGSVLGGTAFSLPPIRVLEGTGRFRGDVAGVSPLTNTIVQEGKVSFATPPGIYGNDSLRVAHNLASAVPNLKPLQNLPASVSMRSYDTGKGQTDLGGIGLSLGFTLLALDLFVLLAQRNALSIRPRRASAKTPVTLDNGPGL